MANVTWKGSGSGDWSVTANWSDGVVPGIGDAVSVPDPIELGYGPTQITVSGSQAAASIQLASLTSIYLTGTLTMPVGGFINIVETQPYNGYLYVTGTLVNADVFAASGGWAVAGTAELDGVQTTGAVSVVAGSTLTIKDGFTLQSSVLRIGPYYTTTDGSLALPGVTLDAIGTQTIDGGPVNFHGAVLTNGGTLTLGALGAWSLDAGQTGEFGGTGAVVNEGSITAGPLNFGTADGGTLTITPVAFENDGIITDQVLASIAINSPLSGAGSIALKEGATLTLGSTATGNAVQFVDATGTLVLSDVSAANPDAVTTPIEGFQSTPGIGALQSDILRLPSVPYVSSLTLRYDGTTLTVINGNLVEARLTMPGLPLASGFLIHQDTVGSYIVACYARGTRILTPSGEVPIEALRVGDTVVTRLGGETAPIVWIGRRQLVPARHPRPDDARPVRIEAGAFGPGLPHRRLWVSPQHALYLDGRLVPAILLANGGDIRQVNVASVEYFHVELPRHDVIIAEGIAAESYRDTGNRAAFGPYLPRHPHWPEMPDCAPRVIAESAGRQCRSLGRPEPLNMGGV